MAGSRTREAGMRTILDSGDVQPGTRVSLIAADQDDDSERFDAADGCEFVDDRIRLLE